MKNQLSTNLIALMDYHRIGGVKLARAINIPLSTIKNIRLGKNVNPTIETLIPLAHYFNRSLEEMIYGNFSVEKLAEDKSRATRHFPQSVPVIFWEEAADWSQPHSQNDWKIYTEKQCSEQTFAIYLKQKVSDIFTMPGVILIDPLQKPTHFDYVLVHKRDLRRPSIKQLVCEEDLCYLKSLVMASKLEPFNKNYKLLGVVIEYRQFFKWTDTGEIKKNIHRFSLQEQAN